MNLNFIIQKKKKRIFKNKSLEEYELNELEIKEILTNHNINKISVIKYNKKDNIKTKNIYSIK